MSKNKLDKAAYAQKLGARLDEIVDVLDSPAGVVITTRDGVSMIDVPDDRPDAEGKTGLMLLAKPDPTRTYSCPVFAQPPDEAEVEPEADAAAGEPGPETAEDDPVPDGSVEEVLAWVDGDPGRAHRALDVEQGDDGKQRVTLVPELEAIITGDEA